MTRHHRPGFQASKLSLIRWLLPAAVAASLAGCGGAMPATSTPPATTSSKPAPTAQAASATPTAATKSMPTSTQTPARTASPTRAVAGTPTAAATPPARSTPAAAVQADLWQVDGQPVMQAAVAAERRYYVTTEGGLYAVNGEQVERRAGSGEWPNLVAVNESILLSGDKMACARGGGGTPLRRSVDGGRTWQVVQAAGVQGGLMARPVPTLGADLFAVACDGLYRSTDSGATWQRLAILGPDHEVVDLATTPGGDQLYMVALFGEGGTTRLAVAERQGERWSQARTLNESWGGGVVTVGREQGRTVIYFGTPLGLFVSRDGGASWQAMNQGLDSTILLADPREGALPPAEEAKLRRAVGIYSLAADLERPRVLLGGADGVYALREGRWQKLPVLEGQLVREVFTDLQGQAYARTDTGVHRLRGL